MSFNPNLFDLPMPERRALAAIWDQIIINSPNIIDITPYVVARMGDFDRQYKTPAQVIDFEQRRHQPTEGTAA